MELESSKTSKYSSRYINNILGFSKEPKEIEEIKEREEEDEEDFSVRKYLDSECERMLK